jgi:D-alanine-D-alanine ligase-like ATP-grasp enzyme
MTDLSHPASVQARLEEIDRELAVKQNDAEAAAMDYYRCKRTAQKQRAEAFLTAEGSVAQRNAIADRDTSHIGMLEEGRWEGLKAVVRTLDTRAAIGMSLLRAQSRGG